MPLTWDATKIKTVGSTPFDSDGQMCSTTHGLIWAGLLVSLQDITEENAAEWFVRCTVLASILKTPKFSLIEIHNNIGLHTNCEDLSRTSWLARVRKMQKTQLDRALWMARDESKRQFFK